MARAAVEAEQDSRHLPNMEFRATSGPEGWAVEVRTFGGFSRVRGRRYYSGGPSYLVHIDADWNVIKLETLPETTTPDAAPTTAPTTGTTGPTTAGG